MKLKEITYAHCEGMFSSESKHGPLSAVRGGRTIAVAIEHEALRKNVHDYLVLPEADRFTIPILATIPAQPVTHPISIAHSIDPGLLHAWSLSKTLAID